MSFELALLLFPMRVLVGTNAVVSGNVVRAAAVAHAEPESPAADRATADHKEDPSGLQCPRH